MGWICIVVQQHLNRAFEQKEIIAHSESRKRLSNRGQYLIPAKMFCGTQYLSDHKGHSSIPQTTTNQANLWVSSHTHLHNSPVPFKRYSPECSLPICHPEVDISVFVEQEFDHIRIPFRNGLPEWRQAITLRCESRPCDGVVESNQHRRDK